MDIVSYTRSQDKGLRLHEYRRKRQWQKNGILSHRTKVPGGRCACFLAEEWLIRSSCMEEQGLSKNFRRSFNPRRLECLVQYTEQTKLSLTYFPADVRGWLRWSLPKCVAGKIDSHTDSWENLSLLKMCFFKLLKAHKWDSREMFLSRGAPVTARWATCFFPPQIEWDPENCVNTSKNLTQTLNTRKLTDFSGLTKPREVLRIGNQ